MKKIAALTLTALLLTSCGTPSDVVTQREQDAATATTTPGATMSLTSTTEPAAPVENLSETEDFDFYEMAGISYQIPTSWKIVHTDNDSTSYQKYKSNDFSFSVQYYENFYVDISQPETEIMSYLQTKFKTATLVDFWFYEVDGKKCFFFVLSENSDPEHLTIKLACQAKKGTVYFNIFDYPDKKSAENQICEFAKNISGNVDFYTSKNTDTTTTTTAAKKKTTTTKNTTTAKTTTKPKTTTTIATTTTVATTTTIEDFGNWNAVRAAKSYISFMAFSRSGLIKQLEYEGYSHADAEYAADNCGANWTNQAMIKAKDYIDLQAFSRSGLIHQLEYEGFSQNDAVYATDALNVDWNEQAAKKAQDYISLMAFSRDSLIHQLKYEGFTDAQAAFGASAVGY